jgi:hypothetical protein
MPVDASPRPPRLSPRDQERAVQAKRLRFYRERLGRAHRPTDRLGLAIDFLRGALADAPSPEIAAREVDVLVRQVEAAVDRLHAAAVRSAAARARTRRR